MRTRGLIEWMSHKEGFSVELVKENIVTVTEENFTQEVLQCSEPVLVNCSSCGESVWSALPHAATGPGLHC